MIQAPMNMAEQVPGIPPRSMPFAHRIMAKDDTMLPEENLAGEGNARKKRSMTRNGLVVVIPRDKVNFPVQLSKVGVGAKRIAKTKVAEVIDGVVRSNTIIPARDEHLVHLRDVLERPLAGSDDIFVPEMGIRGKKNSHVRLALRAASVSNHNGRGWNKQWEERRPVRLRST